LIGNGAASGVTTGSNNVIAGWITANAASFTAGENVILGTQAGSTLVTGSGNTIVGYNANVSGSSVNNAVLIGGNGSGGQFGARGGSASVIIGAAAGNANLTGTNNIIFGLQVASTTLTTGSNNVLIGTNSSIDTASGTTSNTIQIGAGSTAVISATGCGTPSTSILTAAGSLVVNSTTGGVMIGSSGPTLTSGAGAPSATQPVGSLYMNTSGSSGSRLYVSAGGGSWNPVSGV
jgi:hypothetical protein